MTGCPAAGRYDEAARTSDHQRPGANGGRRSRNRPSKWELRRPRKTRDMNAGNIDSSACFLQVNSLHRSGQNSGIRPPEDAGPSQSADYLPPAASGFTMRYREGGVDRVPLAVLFPGGRGRSE